MRTSLMPKSINYNISFISLYGCFFTTPLAMSFQTIRSSVPLRNSAMLQYKHCSVVFSNSASHVQTQHKLSAQATKRKPPVTLQNSFITLDLIAAYPSSAQQLSAVHVRRLSWLQARLPTRTFLLDWHAQHLLLPTMFPSSYRPAPKNKTHINSKYGKLKCVRLTASNQQATVLLSPFQSSENTAHVKHHLQSTYFNDSCTFKS